MHLPDPHSGRRRSRTRWGVTGAVLAAALGLLYVWTVRTADGQSADIVLFAALQDLNPTLGPLATVLRPALLPSAALVCAALGILALVGRRRSALAAAVLVVALSVLSTRVLKDVLLERPYLGEHGYTVNTFPSGHVSATLALLVAAVVLCPTTWGRAARTVGLLVVVASGAATCGASLLGHAHRPGDVAGAVLLVGAVTALTIVILGPPRCPRHAPSPP